MRKKIFLFLFFGMANFLFGSGVIEKNGKYYAAGTVIAKLKKGYEFDEAKINNALSAKNVYFKLNAADVKRLFPNKIAKDNNSLYQIIEINYSSPQDPEFVSDALQKSGEFEWVEPRYVYKTSLIPNDPFYASKQWYLTKIQAEQAWDITTGSSNVVIAIVDTGVDWTHPDLSANIWTNPNEIPNNGIDDDNNGYIDDVRGWDFGGLNGTPDNDPKEDRPDHGTHVAGIASAVTNNGVGVASIGYSCKIMPVKSSRDDWRDSYGNVYVAYGFEGIVYAANNGAKIINCSWGGGGYTQYGREIIDYALSKGSLVVAAAGNESRSDIIYPSKYDGVLSVVATDNQDKKASFSNYGYDATVSAPGASIYNTWQPNTYTTLSGTSMASPLVAGLAGLVAAKFPNYGPLQILEQIRVNADNIDALNPSYAGRLGSGRINAYKAVNNSNSVSIRPSLILAKDLPPDGNNNGILEPNEKISILVEFTNYLASITSFSAVLSSSSTYLTVINGSFNGGALATNQKVNNYSSPFVVRLSSNVPVNSSIVCTLTVSSGSFSSKKIFTIEANLTYATVAVNNIEMTFTSKGALGFNDYPNNTKGKGFVYNGVSNLLFEGALMYGINDTKLCDAARESDNQLNNFKSLQNYYISIPGNKSAADGYAKFNDDNAGTMKIGIETTMRTYAWDQDPYKDFIIIHYNFKNTTTSDVSNFYAGLFFDWDMIDGNGGGDKVFFNSQNSFGYVANVDQQNYPEKVAMATPGYQNLNFFAIKNGGGDAGGFSIYDGFTKAEKWQALTGGLTKTSTPDSGDISCVISQGPFTISTGQSIDVYFIVACSYNMQNLISAVSNARAKIAGLTKLDDDNLTANSFELYQNYPNPFNPITTIKYNLQSESNVSLKVYDIMGRLIKELINEKQSAGVKEVVFDASGLASGIYLYELKAGSYSSIRKMTLIK
jgi:subtilisin family serine protease